LFSCVKEVCHLWAQPHFILQKGQKNTM
jgi:hypothetical protein